MNKHQGQQIILGNEKDALRTYLLKLEVARMCLQGSSMKQMIEYFNLEQFEIINFLYKASRDITIAEENREYLIQFVKKNLRFLVTYLKKFVFIADTHFGGKYENWPYVYQICEHMAQNNIKTIFILGDLIEGSPMEKRETVYFEDQVQKVIQNFPEFKGLKVYVLFGNHDISALNNGVNMIKMFHYFRKDFHFLNYEEAYVNINGIRFKLSHPIKNNPYRIPTKKYDYWFKGHGHFYKQWDTTKFRVPSLCDYIPSGKLYPNSKPGFLSFNSEKTGFILDHYNIVQRKLIRENQILL